jgi:OmpA-OmpF porin, OOP family
MAASLNIYAQKEDVFWATTVLDFSSELSPEQFAAKQVIGKPNVLPNIMESPNAWSPSNPYKMQYIKVGFEKPVKIRQIAVAESYNASSISKVYIYDINDGEHLLREFIPSKIEGGGRMLNIFIEETEFEVAAIKVEMKGKTFSKFYGIDAIGVSTSLKPIEALVNVADNLRENILIERLSDNVNSGYPELNPIISPDGNKLYFSRQGHPGNIGGRADMEDIWYSEKDSTGNWSIAKNIGAPLNNKHPNFISSVSSEDGKEVLILGNEYKSNGKMRSGVSITKKTEEGWSKPTSIKIKKNYNISESASFFIAKDNKVMILSIEREDSYGDRDLYVSFLRKDNVWTEPLNLGSEINTAEEEGSPFLTADGKTLYFSSNGYSGYGGKDIFVSHRLDDTWMRWSEPQNLGPEINSKYDDEFFTIAENSSYAYFSRGDENDVDIYQVEFPIFIEAFPKLIVKGNVFDSKNNKPLAAKITYLRASDGMEIGVAETNPLSGDYTISLPRGEKYTYQVESKGFLNLKANIDLIETGDIEVLGQDLFLNPEEKDEPALLNNIYFKEGNFTLPNQYFPELEKLIAYIKKNPNIKVTINGHSDNTGKEETNKILSIKRAQQVREFLKTRGIEENRIVIIGFGSEKPVANNKTDEGRRQNRRVEFKLTKN